jgi:phosphoribosyl-ATP pyrophosphohydrolase/phosphoribosyl-AMP cyclohydrolase
MNTPATVALRMPEPLKFDERGLLPVVVQDRTSGDVLMVAWTDRAALELTTGTGHAHFWSRSRQELWKKGETSGNVLLVREVRADCDSDTLLFLVDADGPACHAGTRTCFGDASPTKAGIMAELGRVVRSRAAQKPEGSYTAQLVARGLDHTLKKVGEESTEFLLAAKGESDERLAEEAADLLYHVIVAMAIRGVPFSRALGVLQRRRAIEP